jgi:magnesium transporter
VCWNVPLEVAMDVRVISGSTLRSVAAAELEALLSQQQQAGDDGEFVWVDVPAGDPDRERVLGELFVLHPQAVEDTGRRNPAPKLHIYPGHAFLVLHAPELGDGGHVHYIELDLFLAERFLVTVHGPLNPAVDPALALVETGAVAARMDAGRWLPSSTYDLAHAVVTGMNRRMSHHVETLTTDTWNLERLVTAGHLGDPEQFLEEMFRVRHGLQAVRTLAALDHEVFGRISTLGAVPDQGRALITDCVDQFERVQAMASVQAEYLEGVITLYQTRANMKMTIAAERLAVIAAVTLPVTAVSSVLGMNVIVNDHTRYGELAILLAMMAGMSLWLLLWSRRQGWW